MILRVGDTRKLLFIILLSSNNRLIQWLILTWQHVDRRLVNPRTKNVIPF